MTQSFHGIESLPDTGRFNHYDADGDSPDWIQESASTITRNVQDMDGRLGALTSATGSTVLQLTDIRGDVTVQLPVDTALARSAFAYDEYGVAEGSQLDLPT
ncbi:hypothetical protein [Streptomyces sp. NPDC007905]|uniref:hypothetical protein n=1 Tax=Streptomyces sp. NPDC007905 TaxID=3364788 RepID=UPI0036E6FEF5